MLCPLTLLALSAACTQMLDIQDAWIDPSLQGGANSGDGGRGSSDAGEQSSSGAPATAGSPAGGAAHHAGAGSSSGAGSSAVGASAGTNELTAGAGGGEGPDEPSVCETYCDSVLANCTGKYEQYRTRGQCLEVCRRLPEGAPGDGNTNSVQCRIRQARFADSEALLYCKSAGPLGAGKCGSNCESYCSLMDNTCTQSATAGNIESSYFETNQACMSNCQAMADDPSGPTQYSSSATVEPSNLVGNNVYCRTYHVTAGIEQDAASEHCPHAMGGDPCIAQ